MHQQPFNDPLSQPTLANAAVPDEATREQWEQTCRSGANWFYWVAGLSLVNTLTFILGWEGAFVVGLGATQVVDVVVQAVADELGPMANLFGLMINLSIVAAVAVFGLLAHRRRTWAFAVGMTLYALDGGIFLLVGDWLSLGFHVFVLYCLAGGWSAATKCNRIPTTPAVLSPGGFAARAS